MDVCLVINERLKELGLEQRDLAAAAEVTESYISQLLTRKKLPPAPAAAPLREARPCRLNPPRTPRRGKQLRVHLAFHPSAPGWPATENETDSTAAYFLGRRSQEFPN